MVRAARPYFDRVTVGAQDASRADGDFLLRFAAHMNAAGAHRLRIADTVGIGFPGTTAQLIGALTKADPGLALEFHGHNDLGMATANSIAALEAGARAVSGTVNGLGERAGNSALEQLAMALRPHTRFDSRLETNRLLSLCQLVAHAANRPIAPSQPVVGDMVFTHESGIPCHAMRNDKRAYEPFASHQAGHPPPSPIFAGCALQRVDPWPAP